MHAPGEQRPRWAAPVGTAGSGPQHQSQWGDQPRFAVAVAEPNGEVHSLGMVPNRPESVRKLVAKLGPPGRLPACYEAGPTGYTLYWQLTRLGVHCDVIISRFTKPRQLMGYSGLVSSEPL